MEGVKEREIKVASKGLTRHLDARSFGARGD
jgi:hypothetical protein